LSSIPLRATFRSPAPLRSAAPATPPNRTPPRTASPAPRASPPKQHRAPHPTTPRNRSHLLSTSGTKATQQQKLPHCQHRAPMQGHRTKVPVAPAPPSAAPATPPNRPPRSLRFPLSTSGTAPNHAAQPKSPPVNIGHRSDATTKTTSCQHRAPKRRNNKNYPIVNIGHRCKGRAPMQGHRTKVPVARRPAPPSQPCPAPSLRRIGSHPVLAHRHSAPPRSAAMAPPRRRSPAPRLRPATIPHRPPRSFKIYKKNRNRL